MDKRRSSNKTRCIKIVVNENQDVVLSTQLDCELTIHVLEVCLKNMKEKTSLKAVPIGKE